MYVLIYLEFLITVELWLYFFKKCVIQFPHIIKRVYKGFIWKAEGEFQALHTLQKMKYKALKIDIYFNN